MNDASVRRLVWMAVGTVALLGVLAFVIGFYILPRSQTYSPESFWQTICRAAGVVSKTSFAPTGIPSSQFSTVVVPVALSFAGTSEQIGRGATLGLRCTMCHGAAGLSEANSPNLSGQYADVVYKELIDYQRGGRANSVMTALASTLSTKDITELAQYYAYLPRPGRLGSLDAAPALVRVGDPMRNIAPCASCHGNVERKAESPWLNGEPKTYLEEQLKAFRSDNRQNDINGVMRSVAHQMTSAEISDVATFYAGLTP